MPQEKGDNFFTELLKFVIVAVLIVVPIRLYVAQPFIVSGASMDPTFGNGQYLIIDELSYHLEAPARGDVIIFHPPQKSSEYYIKRIIGLPNESVRIGGGVVSVTKVDGTQVALDESYVVNQGNGQDMKVTLNNDEYFVMGDNRPQSSDSRSWGVLPRANIVGRAFLRLLPLQHLSVFPGSTPAQ